MVRKSHNFTGAILMPDFVRSCIRNLWKGLLLVVSHYQRTSLSPLGIDYAPASPPVHMHI